MEDYWEIESGDGFTIHGILDHAAGDQATPEKAVIIIHGLTGNPHEYIHESAADFFTEKGYDVIRPYLYGGENGRALVDCTLETHAQDVNTIVNNIRGKYKKLFLVGHSYGGPTVMIAKPNGITAVSLWDPSFNMPALWEMSPPKEILGLYVARFGGVDHLLGEAMIEEGRTRFGEKECLKISGEFTAPVQVIGADESDEADLYAQCSLSWHSGYEGKKECIKVAGADHIFVRGESCDKLLNATLKWFEQF